jgi:hypothetical protein
VRPHALTPFDVFAPPAEVKKSCEAVVAAFNTQETKDAMAKQENVIYPMTPEAPPRFFTSEGKRYAKLDKKTEVKLD